jgi:hypothetical protein
MIGGALVLVVLVALFGPRLLMAWGRHEREAQHCARCGYIASPNTVLIPAGRCPSCGALLAKKGSSRS